MSLDQVLFIGMGIFLGISVILQIYIAYRIRKYQQNPVNISESKMSAKGSFRLGLFHTLFYSYMLIFALYNTWIGKFSWLLGGGFILVGLISIRKPIAMVRGYYPVHADSAIALPLLHRSTNVVTPEFIQEILREESVVNAIREDLQRIHQIGGKEQWRLGLLAPDMDTYSPMFQIPIKRGAIIHPTTFFNAQFKNVMISHGTRAGLIESYPAWSYGLRAPLTDHEYRNIRDLEIGRAHV